MESKVKLQHFSVCKSGINGYYFVISVSARSAVSISSCVFHHPKENRIVFCRCLYGYDAGAPFCGLFSDGAYVGDLAQPAQKMRGKV